MLAAAVVALLGALLGAGGSARADTAGLVGNVGLNDAYTITFADAAGNKVTHLDPGTYTLTLHDHSSFHNFHLSGPGVDASTEVDFIGDKSFTVTFTDGTYFFNCDPHSSQMKGTFTVGTVVTPPAPAPSPAPARLAASIGPGTAFSLRPAGRLAAGKAVITVRDRSASDGFRLSGPGLVRSTGAAFRGTVSWKVSLRAGRYSFGSVKHPLQRRVVTVSP
jgi:hypothetical protein